MRTRYHLGVKYGNLMIDIPKLMGQLHLVAKKDGEKVLDKKVDFDTLDLLTKRFNSKKKYSDLSKMVFNQLNKLGELPIHRTSKKFSKLGSGVVYYNDTLMISSIGWSLLGRGYIGW